MLDLAGFGDDPIGFLAAARAAHGDVFVLRDGGPVFSRAADCAGVVAVFGAAGYRAVLGDIATFGMPISAARQLALPPAVVNLTRGLHSMRGDEHAAQRRIVSEVLAAGLPAHRAAVAGAVDAVAPVWRRRRTVRLLAAMRELARELSARLLFGAAHAERADLAALLEAHFRLRREVSAPGAPTGAAGRELLVALGTELDAALRSYVRACRATGGAGGIFGRLAGAPLPEDAVVAHANVLFVSSTEPIAIALTWILLVLSQLPALRAELRREPAGGDGAAGRPLLDRVIAECLRLLPPNAMMARITTRATELAGAALPARCEIVLCPFLAHRDPERFADPARFAPARWTAIRPSPFDYLPFGAGGHACAGRALAGAVVASTLAELVARHDIVLAGDQDIDWRLHIQLMPRVDPLVRVQTPGVRARSRAGAWRGPIASLVQLTGS